MSNDPPKARARWDLLARRGRPSPDVPAARAGHEPEDLIAAYTATAAVPRTDTGPDPHAGGDPVEQPGENSARHAGTDAAQLAGSDPVVHRGTDVASRAGTDLAVRPEPHVVPSGGRSALTGVRLSPVGQASGEVEKFQGWFHHHKERGRHGRISLALLAVVILMCVAVFGWRLMGGRMLVMQTASMCPRVCVGSLIADRPLAGPLHVGELVTFYPPGDITQTYTHQIVHILPDGFMQTKGFANPAHDPWVISPRNVVGRVVFTVPDLGWLLKVLPLLAVGVMAWVIVRPHISARFRRGWDRMWIAALLIVPIAILRPLLDGQLITSSGTRVVKATVVNSGLLPESFRTGGKVVARHVAPGHLARVAYHVPAHGAPYLRESASLAWWGWVLVGLAIGWPLIGFIWHFLRDDETPPTEEPARHPRPGQPALTG